MHARDFAFWLQGFFELRATPGAPIDSAQARQIEQHLALVFQHDPNINIPAHPALEQLLAPNPVPTPNGAAVGGVPTKPLMIC